MVDNQGEGWAGPGLQPEASDSHTSTRATFQRPGKLYGKQENLEVPCSRRTYQIGRHSGESY